MSEPQTNKVHRKGKEKSKKFDHGAGNPKAFAFAKPGKLQRRAARSHDVKEKRLHVPLVDRIPEDPPPFVVAVVGPPGVCCYDIPLKPVLIPFRLAKRR